MTDRAKLAYDTFRGGFRPGVFVPPPWATLKDWVRDGMTVAYLQGKLDGAGPDVLASLQELVTNILDYEKQNNFSPNPGRKYCWNSVERAVAVIEKATGSPETNKMPGADA